MRILFEDEYILAAEEPQGMPSQADKTGDPDLLSELETYVGKPLGLLHRLDRPVGGVMVFAKTSKAASRLSKQVSEHSLKKTYYAVVCGKVKDKDTLVDYLYKDTKKNISYVVDKAKGKESILDYKLICYKDSYSLVEINLKTGRSHQIRVQFSSRGFPLVGDAKYNKNHDGKTNVALFAKKLEFIHPVTCENLSFELDIPKRYPFNLF